MNLCLIKVRRYVKHHYLMLLGSLLNFFIIFFINCFLKDWTKILLFWQIILCLSPDKLSNALKYINKKFSYNLLAY